jgi:long-chain acyl-CoA synthetase
MPGSDVTTLADAVRAAAARAPDRPALVPASGPPVTWGELDRQVDAVATALRDLGLPATAGHPARVAIALPNIPEFAVTLFAVLRAGLVAVPVNPEYTARELRHQLDDCGAAVLVATPDVAVQVAQMSAPRHVYTLDGTGGGRPYADLAGGGRDPLAAGGGTDPPGGRGTATAAPEDLAVLLYTSGTAGNPKGAMLTHAALAANHRQLAAVDPPIVRGDDVVLLALPLFHAFGLNSGLGAVAWHGAVGVLVDRFDPRQSLEVIAGQGVTVVAAVPQMYAAWCAQPGLGEAMASVRVAVSGAAPLDPDVARRFRAAAGRPLTQGYGLTETAPVLTTALASPAVQADPVAKATSIGRPIPGVEVRLVAADGGEIALIDATGLVREDDYDDDFDDDAGGAPGTDPGEIVVRGPNLFRGYWPDGAGGPDADGWWATGDVAYADADGDLFLVDRLGELILVSGFNVYPHEIELVLSAHPAVAEAAVLAVPSAETGQAVKAFVVPAGPRPPAVAELMAHCRANLARFKCPVAIEVVPELPHSATGKVRKRLLADRS